MEQFIQLLNRIVDSEFIVEKINGDMIDRVLALNIMGGTFEGLRKGQTIVYDEYKDNNLQQNTHILTEKQFETQKSIK